MTANKTDAAKKLDELIADAMKQDGERTPPTDLWRGIEHSLTRQQQGSGRWLNWVWASAASMVVAVGVMTAIQMEPQQQQGIYQLVNTLTTQHQQQRDMMLTSYEQAGLSRDLEQLEPELVELREAARQITAQLKQDPNNQALWDLLQWVHQQELNLIRTSYETTPKWQQA
ncbi:hypothetical protein IDSA_10920 [Pseudidiomarina salinarum]|uniref:Uncharacterized protein n=1 Tax=Pseudidiomarina salinarum TaxID=435908 RepID=A0A094IRE8_9GAMM|nr:hypothetical protein [Pseudidiomarina salinarum]KFZ30260.1 hypothetical protein IDSA_10920 [Pseudidiomarina salinarum]RUO69959.1 hypothetical protein CWI79_00350 [Pseudidiomarina salinarum]